MGWIMPPPPARTKAEAERRLAAFERESKWWIGLVFAGMFGPIVILIIWTLAQAS